MILYVVTGSITLISAFLGVVFAFAAVRIDTGDKRQTAFYMLARSIALTAVAAISLWMQDREALMLIAFSMLIVQMLDCLAGIYLKHRMRTIGPFIMAAAHAICLIMCLRAVS